MQQRLEIKKEEILSDGFYTLKNLTYDLEKQDGKMEEQTREVYQTANGATALLYNLEKKTVILTRQFRIATVLNGNETGMIIETCAGLIENESPKESILREIEEETGYRLKDAEMVFQLYSSPGATTEKLFYFIAEYKEEDKANNGGGLEHEQEEIEVIELPFKDAYLMVRDGRICDAKTVQLLQYAQQYLFDGESVFDVL